MAHLHDALCKKRECLLATGLRFIQSLHALLMHRKTDLHSLNDRGLHDDWNSIHEAKAMNIYLESNLEVGNIADA